MTTPLFRQWLLQLFLALACLGAVTPAARADALDDFVSLYKDIEDEVGSSNMPVSAYYLEDSKNYMRCLAGGTDVLVCTDQYHDTGAGKDAANQTGIPSGFWMALDAYVAYKQGDYWSAAWSLGQAAACIALQILAGNTDICGLVQELYEIAKGIYEGGAALLGFLGDVAGAAWDAVSGAANALCEGLTLCDDDDDGPPLHVTMFQVIYSPHTQEGVHARESTMTSAYDLLLVALSANATAWANQLYAGFIAWQPSAKGQIDAYIKSSVATAENGFTTAVDAAWTGDILSRVVKGQQQPKRAQYVADGIGPLAESVAAKFIQSNNDPDWLVFNECNETFSSIYGFAMVDRWIAHFPQKASEFQVKTNMAWCKETVWGAYKYKFVKGFGDYLKTHVCAASGDAIVCDSLEHFQKCSRLMGSVGQQGQCKVNALKLGKEAAAKVQADFNARGSKIPCATIVPTFSFSLGNPNLVQLQCTRPTQRRACDDAYQKFFAALPTKVLNCTLKENSDYTELKGKVVQAVAALNAKFGAGSFAINDAGDPLLVYAADRGIMGSAQDDPQQDRGFGSPSSQSGFEYRVLVPKTVDGLSTPAIWFEINLAQVTRPVQSKVGGIREQINPADLISDAENPVVNPLTQGRLRAPMAAGNLAMPQQQQQQVMSGSLPALPAAPGQLQVTRGVQGVTRVPSTVAAGLPAQAPVGSAVTSTSSRTAAGVSRTTPGLTGGLPALAPVTGMGSVPLITGAAGGQTEVRSGPAPQGAQQTQSTMPALTTSPPRAMQTAPAVLPGLAAPGSPGLATTRRLPDLMYAGMPRVGGAAGGWNGSVTVNALQATRTGGLCYFPLDYTISNGGQQESGQFRAAMTNTTVPGSGWQRGLRGLAPGASLTDSGTIALRPGRNSLQFVLDDMGTVAETNEANNRATLAVNVTGQCESFSPAPPAPANDPGRLIGPGLIRR